MLGAEGDADALADAALEAWKRDEFALAEDLWQQAAALGSARAMVNLGRNRIDEEDLDGAAVWFLRAVDAGSADGAVWMGRMAFERGDVEEQEAWRWRAADLGDAGMLEWLANREPDPNPGESFNVALMRRAAEAGSFLAGGMMSVRAFDRDEYEECITWGERAFTLQHQEVDPAQVARLHMVVGAAYRLTGRPAQALPHYEVALAIAPEAVQADASDVAALRRELGITTAPGAPMTAPSIAWASPTAPAASPTHTPEVPGSEAVSPGAAPVRFCTQCGSARDTGARFCSQCGSPFP